jgi:glycosyltransferase involved in cell wall biosynthesis
MNIAVNTRLLLKDRLEGIGWFSCETLRNITINHPEHTFYFIFDRPYDQSFIFAPNVKPIVAGPPTRHPFLWYFWLQFVIPRVLRKTKADVFLSPDGFLSLRTKVPQVAVIHDINFYHQPKQLPFWVSWFYNRYFPKFANKAASLGTVSEYSKSDIVSAFNVAPEKITVCYNGSNPAYVPVSEEQKMLVKQKYSDGEDYFLFIGALNPRKNVPGLLKSYELYRQSYQSSQKLIIVGSAMHLTGEIEQTLSQMKYADDVIFAGRLDVADLHLVLASALALVYIPFFEGFGIPLVEAMYAGTAIISGNRTSLPEVVGDAALLCDPDDHQMVAKYMNDLSSNPELRKSLIEKGFVQSKKFSWEKSGERLWQCLSSAINLSGNA